MLTNTAPDHTQDPTQITAPTIAINDAERRCRAALRDLTGLVEAGQISVQEAAALETETLARFTTRARELESRGAQIVAPALWANYEDRAARRCAAAVADRRRSPRLRGVSKSVRALRERQMCVVASARVPNDMLRWLRLDDDEESLAMRGELAAAGLL
jgi:hypothetical protein